MEVICMQAFSKPRCLNILLADDDADDRLMACEAINRSFSQLEVSLRCVEDGEELLECLRGRGRYASVETTRYPDIILLDLNMPRKNGLEALREIKSDEQLRHIPVIILTTSKEQEDIYRTYDLGVNSFISKPVSYDSLVNTMKILGKYWFEVVQLPPERIAG